MVVAGSGPLLLAVAAELSRSGARIQLIAEQASWEKIARFGWALARHPHKLLQGLGLKMRLRRVPYRFGCWPVRAEGGDLVRQVTLTDGARSWTVDCDYLACGFNLVPNLELPQLLGCALADGFVRVNPWQETSVPNVFCAGEPTGIGGVDCALVEGEIAGLAASGRQDQACALFKRRQSWHLFRVALHNAFALRPELRHLPTAETIVCRCEDVTRAALQPYQDWTTAKLHTRCGMGACQGRTCGAATQFLLGWRNESIRPPVFPVSLEALAGPSDDLNTTQTHSEPTHNYGPQTGT